MKALLFGALTLTALMSNSFADSARDYACIAERLQAYNSDIYYNLSDLEIDELIASVNDVRSAKVVEVAIECGAK